MTETTVQVDKNGYYGTRIPKHLGDSLELEAGDKIEWFIDSGQTLRLKVK